MSAAVRDVHVSACGSRSSRVAAVGALVMVAFACGGCVDFYLMESSVHVDGSVTGSPATLAFGGNSPRGEACHHPFYAPEIAVTRQEDGDRNWLLRSSLPFDLLCGGHGESTPSLAVEFQRGTNQDGYGGEAEVRVDTWKDWSSFSDLILDFGYKKIDRERFRAKRFLVMASYRPWMEPLLWGGKPDPETSFGRLVGEARLGVWFGEVKEGTGPAEDEWGWRGEVVLRLPPRLGVHPREGKYSWWLEQWPFLYVQHDSLNGTQADLLLGGHDWFGLQVSLGYSWMRWGEGATAGVFYRRRWMNY